MAKNVVRDIGRTTYSPRPNRAYPWPIHFPETSRVRGSRRRVLLGPTSVHEN